MAVSGQRIGKGEWVGLQKGGGGKWGGNIMIGHKSREEMFGGYAAGKRFNKDIVCRQLCEGAECSSWQHGVVVVVVGGKWVLGKWVVGEVCWGICCTGVRKGW